MTETFYRGTNHEVREWSLDYVGQGDDQLGPGVYFTSNLEDAGGYARKGGRGYLYTVELRDFKYPPKEKKVVKEDMLRLIKWADDYEETLEEYYAEGSTESNLKEFFQAINGLTYFEACLEIDTLFYRDSGEWCRNMVSLGFDGHKERKGFMNTDHIVAWNMKKIKTIEVF